MHGEPRLRGSPVQYILMDRNAHHRAASTHHFRTNGARLACSALRHSMCQCSFSSYNSLDALLI